MQETKITLTPLFSGSSGNAILVHAGRSSVLVDAGVSARAVCGALECAGLDARQLSAVVITHEHADHIKGVPMLAKKTGVPVYASNGTWRAMHAKFRDVPNFSPILLPDGPFYIGSLLVEAFPLSHDAAEPVGYAFFYEGEKAAVATDTGYISRGMMRALEGAKSILLESNHDPDMLQSGPYPYVLKQRVASRRGHLSNADCARALVHLAQTGTTRIYLGHLSRQNNDPDLALAVNRRALEEAGFAVGEDIFLAAAAPAMFEVPARAAKAADRGR